MTSIDDDRDPQVQQLERMKNEFLVAQQRRRERAAAGVAATTVTVTGHLWRALSPMSTGIAALRP